MKKVLLFLSLMSMLVSLAYSQTTSLDNYEGIWENAASWTGGVAPPVADPANLTNADLDLTINGYITRTGDINMPNNTPTKNFIINDTLVIKGDLSFPNDAAELIIGPDAVFIVVGNVSFGNNTVVTNNGIFVVSYGIEFANGESDIYDDSGGGELFVQGSVTKNDDAEGANNWGQLDDIYPVIYEFVICEHTGGSGCILPVVLSYFEVELRTDVVELKWATTMEENFREFVVQRSANGTEFEDIGSVAGKGFDIYGIESNYAFTDTQPLIGNNYYRLKAIDLDDQFEYFGVKVVKVFAPKHLTVYPNPSLGSEIAFMTNFNPAESARITIINQLGIEIFRGSATSREATISFDDKLRAGIYFLRYASNDFNQTARIVVSN